MTDISFSSGSYRLYIGICDDEPLVIDYLSTHLKNWADMHGYTICISAFSSAEHFLFEYENNTNFDILILDIQMGKMNGVELAHKIRSTDRHVQLIFITALTDYFSEGYEVSALHYLVKPVSPEKLFHVMERAIQNLQKPETFLLITADQTTRRIPLNNILCAEAFSHYVLITTTTETIEIRENISDLAKQLGEHFVRPHRSYLVNLRYIYSISKTTILLDNQKTIPLSRYQYQNINRKFIDYHRNISGS